MEGGRRREEIYPFRCSASEKQEVLNFLRKAVAADGPAPDALAQ